MERDSQAVQERNFHIVLASPVKVSEPWLEAQAIRLGEALIRECSGLLLGPSVSANFAENGFEVDVTVEAGSLSEAYDKLGRALSLIEREANIEIGAETDEIQSSFASGEHPHGYARA